LERLSEPTITRDILRPSAARVLLLLKNDGLQNQDVLYVQRGLWHPAVLIDPNEFSKTELRVSPGLLFPGREVCGVRNIAGGSDWRDLRVMESHLAVCGPKP
jgi:hypothetical protein